MAGLDRQPRPEEVERGPAAVVEDACAFFCGAAVGLLATASLWWVATVDIPNHPGYALRITLLVEFRVLLAMGLIPMLVAWGLGRRWVPVWPASLLTFLAGFAWYPVWWVSFMAGRHVEWLLSRNALTDGMLRMFFRWTLPTALTYLAVLAGYRAWRARSGPLATISRTPGWQLARPVTILAALLSVPLALAALPALVERGRPTLPNGWQLHRWSPYGVVISKEDPTSGQYEAMIGPDVRCLHVRGAVLTGRVSPRGPAPLSRGPTYFVVDTATRRVWQGLDGAAWRERLREVGLAEPPALRPSTLLPRTGEC